VRKRTEAEHAASGPVPAAQAKGETAKIGPEAMKAKIAYRVAHTQPASRLRSGSLAPVERRSTVTTGLPPESSSRLVWPPSSSIIRSAFASA
jgi:hypothetical protein